MTELDLREQLSSLQGLLVLAMVMMETADDRHIVELAATSVQSLGKGRFAGLYFLRGGWQATADALEDAPVRADVEAQFAVLSSAGGALAVMGSVWAWAFPLRSLDGHFGYLVVSADREPPTSEQFLLRVLAQEAGIALANARLHASERAAAASLRLANASLAATVAALEQSRAIHERLTRVAVAGEGQQGIADALFELTGYPIAVENRQGQLQAWGGPDRPAAYLQESHDHREELLARAQREGQPVRDGWRLIAVASPDHDVLGVLVLFDPLERSAVLERTALEHGATVLAVELAQLRSTDENEQRLGHDLVEGLLTGTDDEDATQARARALGYDLTKPHRVAVVEPDTAASDQDAFVHAVRRAARDSEMGALLAPRRDVVVVLSQYDPQWSHFRAAIVAGFGGGACRIGVGGTAATVADLPRSMHEARLALKMETAAGSDSGVAIFDDLGVFRLLAELGDVDAVEQFATAWLGALLDYDTLRNADLVATLTHYLESGRTQEAAANALMVHRSTLKYRLQRIAEISGHDLSDPDTTFNLQLATRAWKTLLALRR